MKKENASMQVGLCSALLSCTGVTLGHYWSQWPLAYFVCLFGALAMAVVFSEL